MTSETRKTTKLEVEVFGVEDIDAFRQRVNVLRQQNPWETLSNDRRKALVLLIRDGLLRMLEDPDEWLPKGVIAEPGHLAVVWHIEFEQLDELAIQIRQDAERHQRQLRHELLTFAEELRRAED